MHKGLKILAAVIIVIAVAVNARLVAGTWTSPTETGTFTAAVLCSPNLIFSSNVGFIPPTSDLVSLGNFFKPAVYTEHNFSTGDYFFKWEIIGPAVDNSSNPINYTITVTYGFMGSLPAGIGISYLWWANYNVIGFGSFLGTLGGIWYGDVVRLIPGPTNCTSYAWFKINAIKLALYPHVNPGTYYFPVTLSASCNI